MQRLTIETDSVANANLLVTFLRTVKTVKKVILDPSSPKTKKVEEPVEEYNWTNPSRPATDEECEQMISEAEAEYEAGKFLSAKEALKKTKQAVANWKRINHR